MKSMQKLTRDEMTTMVIASLYNLANAMSAVFMNVYLYAYTGSLVVMSVYTIVRIGLFPFFFTLGGKWAQKHSFAGPLSVGLVFIMFSLLFVLAAQDQFAAAPQLVYVVAALTGVGEGLFWLSLNSLNQIVSSPQSRSRFLAGVGIGNNISAIAAPLVSTLIIDMAVSDTAGYVEIFKLVLVIYALIALVSLRVKARSAPQPFSVLKRMKLDDPQWRYCMITTFFYGMHNSLSLTLAGLLVYNATNGSGSTYGRLLALFAVISILAFAFVSRTMRRNNRMRFYQIGAVLIASSAVVLVLCPTLGGAVYYGVVNALSTPMYANPYQIIVMNAIADYAGQENIVGRVIVRETYQSIGRCLGMAMIVLCSWIFPSALYLPVAVIFCSAFPIAMAVYATIYHRRRDQLKAQGLVK
ncbi:MFS transporter [Holdemania massiliensis]|uniref:MFS transporter n=1 Tax=Holdemania massiliensis TaxID=1468449 RepID=UPI001F061C8F|nr:MFS transporter [Holdemania massiliensis]MCH1939949.1 MFS transporter [Holdemania massiliensis]